MDSIIEVSLKLEMFHIKRVFERSYLLKELCFRKGFCKTVLLSALFTSSPSGKTSCNQPPRPQTPNGTSNSYCSMHPPPTSTNSAHTSNSNYHSRNGVSGSIQFGLVGSSNGGKEKVVGLPPSGRGHRKSKSVGG